MEKNIENRVGYMSTSLLEKDIKDYINHNTIEINGKYKYVGEVHYLQAYKLMGLF